MLLTTVAAPVFFDEYIPTSQNFSVGFSGVTLPKVNSGLARIACYLVQEYNRETLRALYCFL
jgi:hypothetical protein